MVQEYQDEPVGKAVSLLLFGVTGGLGLDLCAKGLLANYPLEQFVFLRSLIGLGLFLLLAGRFGGLKSLATRQWHWHLLRTLMATGAMFGFFYGLSKMPLIDALTLSFTAPLIVTALSVPMLGEHVGWRRWTAVITGFLGVLLILRPGTEAFTWFTLLPVLGGLFYALSALVTRSKCRATPPVTLAVSLNIALVVMGAVASAVLFIWNPAPANVAVSPFLLGSWQVFGLLEWGVVAMLAALMVGNSLVVSAAYQSAPPVIIATFDYNYLIFMTAFGLILFSEIPDRQTIIGMLMIVCAGMMVVRQ